MCSDISDEVKGVCSDVSVNTSRDGCSADEEGPVNQGLLPILGKKTVCFCSCRMGIGKLIYPRG